MGDMGGVENRSAKGSCKITRTLKRVSHIRNRAKENRTPFVLDASMIGSTVVRVINKPANSTVKSL